MRLFEYFKILFGRKKPKLAKNEDVVYGQFRQVTTTLSQRLTAMKYIEKNISEDFALPNGEWFARAVALEIRKDTHNTDKGYLDLHLLHPHCLCDVLANLIYGDKDRLLAYINDNESISNLINKARVLDEKLKQWDEQKIPAGLEVAPDTD